MLGVGIPPVLAQSPGPSNNLGLLGRLEVSATAIIAEGNYVYAGVNGRLVIVDVSINSSPIIVGQTEILAGGWISDIAVSGSHAYVTNGTSGLRIIDVSNPSSPMEIASVTNGAHFHDVEIAGSYAYVLSWHPQPDPFGGMLWTINVANPKVPFVTGSVGDSDGDYNCLSVSGSFAYVCSNRYRDGWLNIFNVADPSFPYRAGRDYSSPGVLSDVAIAGSYAYVASADGCMLGFCEGHGLYVLSVSNPAASYRVGSFSIYPDEIEIVGNSAQVLASDGLHVLDISHRATPVAMAFYPEPQSEYWTRLAVSWRPHLSC
jgi:hypothetical protein